MKDKKIVDVEFQDINKNISGKPLFFTTTQVASIIDEEPSTVRYWSKRFESLLNIQVSNRNKQYTQIDIEKLKYIKKLTKEDGFTLTQVEQYALNEGFNIKDTEEAAIDNNPLAIQSFTRQLTMQLDEKLDGFIEKLLTGLEEEHKQNNEKIKQDIAITVDTVVDDKLNNISNQITDIVNQKNQKTIEKQDKIIELLQKTLENQEKSNKKSLFSRIFHKNNHN